MGGERLGARLKTCARELPALGPASEGLGTKAANRYGLRMEVAVAGSEVLGPLHVGSIPATVFIRDGRIVGAAQGERSEAFFRKTARELFRAPR